MSNKKATTLKQAPQTNAKTTIATNSDNSALNLLTSLLLIAYGYVTVITPNWMAFELKFHPKAEQDLDNIIEYYNTLKEGLGYEVYVEIDEYIESIRTFPFIAPKRLENVRVFFTKKFHFGVYHLTLEETSEIFIVAIINSRQEMNAQMVLNRIADIHNPY